MYAAGRVHEVDLERDCVKGKSIPLFDIVPHHPGQRPASGKCWMVLEGPWQGSHVRPIQYRMAPVEFEKEDGPHMPHWEVFQVTRVDGEADVSTGRNLLIRNDHLVVLGESQKRLEMNRHLRGYQVGSRAEDVWKVTPGEGI